ncbi:hypothetical protein H8S95_06695 [Pontibacter sp. KCTC 32443]|uniref:DUF6503 family protein n=1 Tax=Pontibacter TaxID=323449 RepID=UPI00164E9AF1|nr:MULTISPECIES: DUF6503 family protein [Pontibacter]MBC5773744.1 hypothetical protein [Pontibacter sp. KCTC 32443]
MRTFYTSVAILFVLLVFAGCKQQEPTAQEIVDKAIAAHGGDKYKEGVISFRLRDKQYRALRDNGAFVYSRTFTDSTGQRVYDVLQNSGFTRTINDVEVNLPEERKKAFSNSVNSVIYFALLPYFLNDDAVRKEYLGEATLKGEPYYKVKVTFAQNGGGEDHEDEYVYWFHQQRHTMDYLAYNYKEDDGSIGTRFREAVNGREIGGIRFQDYVNYTSEEKPFQIENYDKAFEAGKLKKVSDINLEEIQVGDLPR